MPATSGTSLMAFNTLIGKASRRNRMKEWPAPSANALRSARALRSASVPVERTSAAPDDSQKARPNLAPGTLVTIVSWISSTVLMKWLCPKMKFSSSGFSIWISFSSNGMSAIRHTSSLHLRLARTPPQGPAAVLTAGAAPVMSVRAIRQVGQACQRMAPQQVNAARGHPRAGNKARAAIRKMADFRDVGSEQSHVRLACPIASIHVVLSLHVAQHRHAPADLVGVAERARRGGGDHLAHPAVGIDHGL